MKKIILALIALAIFIPVNAQYLLDDNYQEEKFSKKKNKEISESYNFGGDASINRGYRGFLDFGLGFCTNNGDGINCDNIMISTTHGYQIIENKLFLGAGIGYWNMYNAGGSSLPLFIDARSEYYNFGKWSLYADLKIGFSIMDHKGFFLDPQLGVRYGLNDKLGLNLGIGYQFFKDTGYYTYEWNGYRYEYYIDGGLGYFNFKVGVDF